MTVTGSYFCAWVRMKFSRNDLPLPGGALDERVPDVVVVQVPEVRRLMLGLEDREAFAAAEMRAGALARCASVNRKLRSATLVFRSGEAPQVVRRVAGHDREPGVQEVVALLVECAVVPGKDFHALGDAPIEPARVAVVDHDRQRAGAEEWPWTSISVRLCPSSWTVAVAESSTSISSGFVCGLR